MFRKNLVVNHQGHGIIYCITQFSTIDTIVQAIPAALRLRLTYSLKAAGLACTIVPIVPIVLCNTVYYAMLLMMNDWIRSKHVQ